MLKVITYSILFSVTFLWNSISGFAEDKESSIPVGCKSYIAIHGSSNVNQFRFFNENLQVKTTSASITDENQIQIPVYDFETSNNRMLKDFYDMVNATRHPFIHISIEPRNKADFDEGSGLTNFKTEVTIAGISNNYIVPSTISGCDHQGYMLQGDLKVKLTDFDIEPPTKLLGAVKVNDEVFIKFAFHMQSGEQLTEQLQD